jgi:hypothetical protein
MSAPTAYGMSKMLTQLTGREVSFHLKAKPAPSSPHPLYGVYEGQPEEKTMVVKADLRLLASFGGLLVGLPDPVVAEQASEVPLGELLRDAIHEVLNVSSTPLSVNSRVVFKTMHTSLQELSPSAREVLNHPSLTTCFDVSVAGYTGGEMIVYNMQ